MKLGAICFVRPASHMGTDLSPGAALLIQLTANVPERAAEDDPGFGT